MRIKKGIKRGIGVFFFLSQGHALRPSVVKFLIKLVPKRSQAAIIKNPYLTLEQVISKTLSFKKNPLRRFIKFQDQIFC